MAVLLGCCGVNLRVSLQEAGKKDVLEQVNGLNIFIHPDMKEQRNGVTLDLEEDNGGMGLVLNGYNNSSCC